MAIFGQTKSMSVNHDRKVYYYSIFGQIKKKVDFQKNPPLCDIHIVFSEVLRSNLHAYFEVKFRIITFLQTLFLGSFPSPFRTGNVS